VIDKMGAGKVNSALVGYGMMHGPSEGSAFLFATEELHAWSLPDAVRVFLLLFKER
jgi:hypothetical protein